MTKFEDFDYYTEGEDESPYVYTCSFVLAIMYFERLKVSNPSYLKSINSSELFLISLVNIRFLEPLILIILFKLKLNFFYS